MTRPLTDTVAVVTGAGRGIGRAIALRLAADGARVALVARSADQLAETHGLVTAAGGSATTHVADVTDGAAVEQVVADVERRVAPIDLLVNNAGLGGLPGPLWVVDPDKWWRMQEVNVRGCFLCMAAVLRRMTARGRGRVVNVSSRVSTIAIAHTSAYTTSKTALTRLSEIAAAEARPHGVLVFAIEPGSVRTAMTEPLIDTPEARAWLPHYRTVFDEGRDASPDDGAALVARIARGDADALTGRFLSRLDDLDALVADAARIEAEDRLTLRLVPPR